MTAAATRNRSRAGRGSYVGVQMAVLTSRKDAGLRGRHEDLRRRIQDQQEERVERRQRVAEVDKSCEENKDIEHQRSDIDQSHRKEGIRLA